MTGHVRIATAAVAAFLLAATAATAVEITASLAVFQQALERDVFNQQGRFYLEGGPGSGCTYAYLERPRLESQGDRLLLRAHFSGRAAIEAFGGCVGPGDAFDVTLSGRPYAVGGQIGLTDLRMESGSDFNDLISRFVTGELGRLAQMDLAAEVARLVATASGSSPYRLALPDFRVESIGVANGRLTLRVNLRMDVDAGGP